MTQIRVWAAVLLSGPARAMAKLPRDPQRVYWLNNRLRWRPYGVKAGQSASPGSSAQA